ncbi:MAG: phage protein D, partial [Cognaticolwellia sp.]
MPTSAVPPWFELKLADEALTAVVLPHLNRVEMSEAVSTLDSITIEFSVPMTAARYTLIDLMKAVPGKNYSFKCGSAGKESKEYTGVIMTVSYSLSRDAMLKITLTGVDELVKLRNARLPQAEGWETLEAALDKMAKDAGFKGGVELVDFQATEKPIFQEGQEDLKFISDFAKANGFSVRVADTKLKFIPVA